MSDNKEAFLVYLSPELSHLIKIYSSQNSVIVAKGIEKILKQFLLSEDNVERIVFIEDSNRRIDTLEAKILELDKVTCGQTETIEKLERQVASLEYDLDKYVAPKVARLEHLCKLNDQV